MSARVEALASVKTFPADQGPAKWLVPFLEARYTALAPKRQLSTVELTKFEADLETREKTAIQQLIKTRQAEKPGAVTRPEDARVASPSGFQSILQPGRGPEVLSKVSSTYWLD